MATSDYLPDSFVKYHLAEAYEQVLRATDRSEEQIDDSKEQWDRRVEILGDGGGFTTLSDMLDRIEAEIESPGQRPADDDPLFPDEHPFESNSDLWEHRRVLTEQIVHLFLLFSESWEWAEIEDAHENVNQTPYPTV